MSNLDKIKLQLAMGGMQYPNLHRAYTFNDDHEYRAAMDGIMDGWSVVVAGEWEQEDDFQNKTNVVEHLETGAFYKLSQFREGSPHTDWNYDRIDVLTVIEVRPTLEMVLVWT